LNALNVATISDLNKAFKILAAKWRSSCYCFNGSGEKHLSQVLIFLNYWYRRRSAISRRRTREIIWFCRKSKTPLLQPWTDIGWRIKLAMACHIRVASENAKMGCQSFMGVIPVTEEHNVYHNW
jgi:enoyl-CoA hydratase